MESHHLKGQINPDTDSRSLFEKMYGVKRGQARAQAAIHKIEDAKRTFEHLMEIKEELEDAYYEIISHKN